MKRVTAVLMILLPLAAGMAGFWLGRTTVRGSEDHSRLLRLQHENSALKETLEKLRSASSATTLNPAPGNARDSRVGPSQRAPVTGEPPYPDDSNVVRALRDSLAAANQSAAEWKERVAQVQTQLDLLKDDQKRLTAIESDLATQLASSKRLLDAQETELTRKTEQFAALEAANKKLRAETGAVGQKAAQLMQIAGELQEIYRRRESYLSTLMNRYREVTEQYRAFASVLENRRGPEGTPGTAISTAGPELARIQNSIAMAEEDLRQLNTLNAQALRIQKKLPLK